jgi:hypothetical protein
LKVGVERRVVMTATISLVPTSSSYILTLYVPCSLFFPPARLWIKK